MLELGGPNDIPFSDINRPIRPPNPNTSTAPVLLGVGGGLLVISTLLLVARLTSRIRHVRHLNWDDWTIIAASLLGIVDYILLSVAVFNGLGRFTRFVSFRRRKNANKLLFIAQVIWYWSVTMTKTSIALMLLRIKRERSWKIFLYMTIALLFLTATMQTFFQFLQCRPFSIFWDPFAGRKSGGVKCIPRSAINTNIIFFSAIQVGVDVLFSFVPITFIYKLNRPRREKILLSMLMALGLFASMGAILRTVQLQNFYNSHDLFRTNMIIAVWATVEQQFGLIAATIPTLKAFFEKTLVRIGLFFYDKESETEVRGRLVGMGLLDAKEEEERAKALEVSVLVPTVDASADRDVEKELMKFV